MTDPGPGPSGPGSPGPGRAASLGFQDLGHRGPQGVRPRSAADSEGRAGDRPVPGAVPFPLPQQPGPPRFTNPPPPPPPPFPPPHPAPPPRGN